MDYLEMDLQILEGMLQADSAHKEEAFKAVKERRKALKEVVISIPKEDEYFPTFNNDYKRMTKALLGHLYKG